MMNDETARRLVLQGRTMAEKFEQYAIRYGVRPGAEAAAVGILAGLLVKARDEGAVERLRQFVARHAPSVSLASAESFLEAAAISPTVGGYATWARVLIVPEAVLRDGTKQPDARRVARVVTFLQDNPALQERSVAEILAEWARRKPDSPLPSQQAVRFARATLRRHRRPATSQ